MSQLDEELCKCLNRELAVFKFFEEHELNDMPCYFSFRKIPEGETIWREGDVCEYMIFILSGHVEIKKETEFKGSQITLGIYGAGSIAGELCMLDQKPRAVTATAIDNVTLVFLSRDNFDKLLQEHTALGMKLLKGMLLSTSTRLRKSFDRLVTIF